MFSFPFRIRSKPSSQQRLSDALARTVALKGKNPAATVNKAGQYVASFAAATGSRAKIPVANANKIEATLLRVVQPPKASRLYSRRGGKRRKVNRKAEVQNTLRGTLAAIIVAGIVSGKSTAKVGRRYQKLVARMTKGSDKEATAAQFYRVVAKFVRMKKGSAGYHRSGMFPAIKAFRAARAGNSADFKSFRYPPGTAEAATAGGKTYKATMEDTARAIEALAPNALRDAMKEVAKQFEKWLKDDLAASARSQGFAA